MTIFHRKNRIAGLSLILIACFGTSLYAEDNTLEARILKLEARLLELEKEPVQEGQPSPTPRKYKLPDGFTKRQLVSERATLEGAGQAQDTDLDGLTNAEELQLGTRPDLPDTDGDALMDGWEVHGVNGIDLASMGANPLHKDIFVEMDYMTRNTASNELKFNAVVINGIQAAFAAASVNNPDGVTGINIHLDPGNEVPYDGNLQPYATEFFTLKAAHFDANRAPVFHYMIWGNQYNGGGSSGVAMGIPHSDFLVTLGAWNGNQGGTNDEKIGTFIHELGHTLGLTHGGAAGDHINNKPNHLSVMNYLFQTRGIRRTGGRFFDYQRFSLPSLRETVLMETVGLGAPSSLMGYFTFLPSRTEVPADGSIDWSENGSIDASPVSRDLNGDFGLNVLNGTNDQWNSLIYNGGGIGSLGTTGGALDAAIESFEPLPYIELTQELDKQLHPNE